VNQLNIHDADLATYTALAVAEQESHGTRWKRIVTPTIAIVMFRPDPPAPTTERSHA
jgi:hypothetical protein